MKKRTRLLSAILAFVLSISLASTAALADNTGVPTPDFSLDFSGYSSESEETSKGIVGTGKAAVISANAEYLTGGVEKVSPTEEFSYLEFDVGNRPDKDVPFEYGVKVDFAEIFGDDTEGLTKEISTDFWINIPGSVLTGKYATYFAFRNSSGAELMLENLNLDKHRIQAQKGNCNVIYVDDYYNTWTHYVVTLKVTDSETEGKKNYTPTVYVNGNQVHTNTQTLDESAAPSSLYLGFNSQIEGQAEGKQKFKLSGFNAYETVLTSEDVGVIFETTKKPYFSVPETNLEYKGFDKSKAFSDTPSITVEFSNYITENYSDKVALLTKDGNATKIDVEPDGKSLVITPETSFAEGEYTLTLSKDLTSFNNYKLGTDLAIPVVLYEDLLFSLDIGDTITDIIQESTVTVGESVKTGSFMNKDTETIKYIQFETNNGTTTDKIEVSFDDAIAADENGKADDITVEFWANISGRTDYTTYARLFNLGRASYTEVVNMRAMHKNTDNRFAVQQGNNGLIYLGTSYNGANVVDTWAHYVITLDVSVNANDNTKRDYTSTIYVNGGAYTKTATTTAQTALDAIQTLQMGHYAADYESAEFKLASFNVYDGVKDADWISDRYTETVGSFEMKDYFSDGPVYIELDTISENLLLKGAQVEVAIKNEFNTDKPYTVYIAGYDDEKRLVDVVLSEPTVLTGDADIVTLKYTASNDTVKEIKAFVWFSDLTPLADAKSDDVFTVALVGDSITHKTKYSRAIETYYMTRYPDREIEFINKGINGHTFQSSLKRFDWDILNEEEEGLGEKADFTNRPDAVTVMLGVNDISHGNYATVDEVEKQKRIDTTLTNAEAFIKKCIEEKLDLTIITPVLKDATCGEWVEGIDLATFGENEGLGRVTDGLKTLAEKYKKGGAYNEDVNIAVVDMWTLTTDLTQKVRDKDSTIDVIMRIPDDPTKAADNVHPNTDGGFVMGYYFAKENGETPYIANVEIGADGTVARADNATVEVVSAGETGVEYKYLAKALPLPVHSSYVYAEQTLGLPVTDDLNQEIIKVTGLAKGDYTITIDGGALSRTYTAEELNSGVNIATDVNNPAQIAAMKAFEEIELKAEIENYYRTIAENLHLFKSYCPGAYTYDELKTAMETTWANNSERLESGLDRLDTYFGKKELSGNEIYKMKTNQQEGWNKMQEHINLARTYATPTQHTVVISAAN